jgi:hypothetical protein
MLVALTTVKEVAAVSPKLTAVAPVKLVPVMVTVSPAAADDGVNELIAGAEIKVKLLEEFAVPPGVVTDIVPVAPFPTTAVMLVALTTVKEVAAVPPKLTAVAPVKLVPVMVTVSPAAADDGVNELIAGAGIKVKLPEEIAVPPGVVIDIVPLVPLATTAVILVALTTVKEVAAVPPKLTAVAPIKLVPVMVTVSPAPADDGVNEPMLGAGIKVKLLEELAVPPGVVTDIIPVVPLATTAVMLVAFTTVKEVAAVPPKLTAVAPVKLVPIMVTIAPVAADDGVNELMVGAGINVKLLEELTVPPGVVIDIVPLVPLATTAVMLVALTTVKEVAAVPPKLTAVAPVKLVPVMVTV